MTWSDDNKSLNVSTLFNYILPYNLFVFCSLGRSQPVQPPANKGTYSQVGFSYDGEGKQETQYSDGDDNDEDEDDDEDDDEDFNSDDSNDEGLDLIAKDFGVKRYGWLVYMDKKAKEEERRQKEIVKGDPTMVHLPREPHVVMLV